MALTDDMLVRERPHPFGGRQRIYRLPNGYGLSLLVSPYLRHHGFAWEAAVVALDTQNRVKELIHDTPLTTPFKKLATDEEANDFIEKAKAWAST